MQHSLRTLLEITELPGDHAYFLGSWPRVAEASSFLGGVRGPAPGPFLVLFFAFDQDPEVSSKCRDLFRTAEMQ